MGDRRKQALRVQFGGKPRLEFHGAKITSDPGLLAFRELDGAFRLTDKGCTLFSDCRRGKNTFSGNKAACNAMCPTVFGTGVGETLGVNQPFFAHWHCLIGQTTHLSYWDTTVMSVMYPLLNWRFLRNSLGSDLLFWAVSSFPMQLSRRDTTIRHPAERCGFWNPPPTPSDPCSINA